MISNMITSALINDLDIVWFPAPRLDSPSVFARILDEKRGGHWNITFQEPVSSISSKYIEGTNVLQTIVKSEKGEINVIDFMPIGMPAIMRIINAPGYIEYRTEFKPVMNYGLGEPYMLVMRNGAQFINPLDGGLMELIILEGNCSKLSDDTWKCIGPAKLLGHYARSIKTSILGGGKNVVYSMIGEALDKVMQYWSNKNVKKDN